MVILSWYEAIFARLLYTCGSLMVSPFSKFVVVKHNLFKNILKVVQQCSRSELATEVTHSLIFHHPWSTWFPHWHLTCALSATLPPPNSLPQPTLLRNDTSAHNMTIPQTFLHRYTHRKKNRIHRMSTAHELTPFVWVSITITKPHDGGRELYELIYYTTGMFGI